MVQSNCFCWAERTAKTQVLSVHYATLGRTGRSTTTGLEAVIKTRQSSRRLWTHDVDYVFACVCIIRVRRKEGGSKGDCSQGPNHQRVGIYIYIGRNLSDDCYNKTQIKKER
jgi:hypothetical protein